MQNTRLNTLVDRALAQFVRFVRNPWRRLSLQLISLLLGNFLATILSTVAGQRAELDVSAALILVAITELISRWVYRGDVAREARFERRNPAPNEIAPARPLLMEVLNGTKIGLIYGMIVEAFKLGS